MSFRTIIRGDGQESLEEMSRRLQAEMRTLERDVNERLGPLAIALLGEAMEMRLEMSGNVGNKPKKPKTPQVLRWVVESDKFGKLLPGVKKKIEQGWEDREQQFQASEKEWKAKFKLLRQKMAGVRPRIEILKRLLKYADKLENHPVILGYTQKEVVLAVPAVVRVQVGGAKVDVDVLAVTNLKDAREKVERKKEFPQIIARVLDNLPELGSAVLAIEYEGPSLSAVLTGGKTIVLIPILENRAVMTGSGGSVPFVEATVSQVCMGISAQIAQESSGEVYVAPLQIMKMLQEIAGVSGNNAALEVKRLFDNASLNEIISSALASHLGRDLLKAYLQRVLVVVDQADNPLWMILLALSAGKIDSHFHFRMAVLSAAMGEKEVFQELMEGQIGPDQVFARLTEGGEISAGRLPEDSDGDFGREAAQVDSSAVILLHSIGGVTVRAGSVIGMQEVANLTSASVLVGLLQHVEAYGAALKAYGDQVGKNVVAGTSFAQYREELIGGIIQSALEMLVENKARLVNQYGATLFLKALDDILRHLPAEPVARGSKPSPQVTGPDEGSGPILLTRSGRRGGN